jgi:hypothetical protein
MALNIKTKKGVVVMTTISLTDKQLMLELTKSPSRIQIANFFIDQDIWRPDIKLYLYFDIPGDMKEKLKSEYNIAKRGILALMSIQQLKLHGSDIITIGSMVNSNVLEIGAIVNLVSDWGWFCSKNCGEILQVKETNNLLQVRIFQPQNGQDGRIIIDRKLYQ